MAMLALSSNIVALICLDITALIDEKLPLSNEVFDDLAGAHMLLDLSLELGDLLLELIELLELGVHLSLALLLLELGLLDLGCGPAALGADLEEVGADTLAH